jgi:hypothetical protein
MTSEGQESGTSRPKKVVLRLTEPPVETPRVTWTEDTVNNEGMNKRSSKSKQYDTDDTCMFHVSNLNSIMYAFLSL